MRRRWFLFGFPLAAVCTTFAAAATTIRGKLSTSKTNPELSTGDGRRIPLTGDAPTIGVLGDDRLQGVDFEATGTPGESKFQIDPIHTKAMFVHKDGKKLLITYWCDVCYIRTYTPGICWCCQKETDLDLRESISD